MAIECPRDRSGTTPEAREATEDNPAPDAVSRDGRHLLRDGTFDDRPMLSGLPTVAAPYRSIVSTPSVFVWPELTLELISGFITSGSLGAQQALESCCCQKLHSVLVHRQIFPLRSNAHNRVPQPFQGIFRHDSVAPWNREVLQEMR